MEEALNKVQFGPDNSIIDDLLRNINLARHEIDIAMFWFNYKPIADALVEAGKRGVHVRVIVDKRSLAVMRDHNGENCSLSAPVYLCNNGISVKVYNSSSDIMHSKLALFDNEHLVASSLNWTFEDLKHNLDHYIVSKDSDLCAHFRQWFVRFWERADLCFLPSNDMDVSTSNTKSGIEIHFSEEEPLELLIEKYINRAEHTIYIMHSIIRESSLVHLLQDAINRGVSVKLVSGKENTPFLLKASSLGVEAKLLKLSGIEKLHHKMIIVDGKIALVGSVNLFDRSLWMDKEHLFVIHSQEVVDAFISEFDRIWNLKQSESIPRQSMTYLIGMASSYAGRLFHALRTRPRLVLATLGVLLLLSLALHLFVLIYLFVPE